MKIKTRKIFAILIITMMLLAMLPMTALAAATVTPAAATTVPAGVATNLAGNIVITETAAGQLTVGSIVITAPANVTFTAGVGNAAVTAGNVAIGAVAVTASTITIPVTAVSTAVSTITIGGVTRPQVNSTVPGSYNLSVAGAGIAAVNCAPITVTAGLPNRFASSASISKSTITADNTDTATVTVYVFDAYNNPVSGVPVGKASSRGTTETFTAPAVTDAFGKTTFTVKSNIAGTATIGVSTDNTVEGLSSAVAPAGNLARYLEGAAGATADAAKLIATFPVTFTPAAVDSAKSTFTATPPTPGILAAVTLSATARNASNGPVAGATVTFEKSFAGGTWVSVGTRTTEPSGITSALITTESVPGDYRYRAMVGTTQLGTNVAITYTGAAAAKLDAVTADGNVARNAETAVRVKVTDAFGNNVAAQPIQWRITRPSGSTLVTEPANTNSDSLGIATLAAANFKPDVLGEYTITATVVGTGITRAIKLTAVEFGAVTKLELSLPTSPTRRIALMTRPATVPGDPNTANPIVAGASTVDLVVRVFDAAGVSRAATNAEMSLSSSNTTLATVTNTNFTVTNGAGSARGLVTITGVHTASGSVATLRIPIVGSAVGMLETTEVTGNSAEVTLQLVDLDVNPTFTVAATPFTVVASAGLSVVESKQFAAGTGLGSIKLAADAPGEYTVTVITTSAPLVSRTFTVEFAPVVPPGPKFGATSVTMFIGSRGFVMDGAGANADVAPFIENGRTFVPVRFIAEALGATADWEPKNAAVKVVTLTRPDKTITINIGEFTITVKEDDVVTTITMDAAAMIKNGRTFLPFRFIAEAFGAEVDFGPKDAPVEWVTFTQ